MKEKLFSVTKEDCEWEYLLPGGHGGQNAQKNHTAVRCTHRASGAVGTSRDERSQLKNKELAFGRMAKSKTFKEWLRLEIAKRTGKSLEDPKKPRSTEQKIRTYDFKEHRVKDTGPVRPSMTPIGS